VSLLERLTRLSSAKPDVSAPNIWRPTFRGSGGRRGPVGTTPRCGVRTRTGGAAIAPSGCGSARTGFFFIPELGYVSVSVEYRVRRHAAGWFWRYKIRDYWTYGLPQPPDGCAWIWVDDDVALIDVSDGYILDIEHNIW
jgi:hypothetical protein